MKNLIKCGALIVGLQFFCGCVAKVPQYDVLCDAPLPEPISEMTIFSIYQHDCEACDITFGDSFYINYPCPKMQLDVLENPENRLLAQVLWNYSFPTNYFIKPDYEIVGITLGLSEFREYSDSIYRFRLNFHNSEMVHHGGVRKENVLPLLSHSLKALYAYTHEKMAEAKTSALTSLQYGDYFFNNYLLYKLYKGENRKDSMEWYRQATLKHNEPFDYYLYDNLIEELR